jgi:hypothetical protein
MQYITSVDEFDLAVANDRVDVLRNVSPGLLTQFRSQLQFVEGVLAHSDYSMLDGHVDDGDLPELFSFFGVSKEKFVASRDLSCVNRVCFVHPRAYCDSDRCRNG